MKLQNDLYTIISEMHTKDLHDYTILFNDKHFIYKAHFPDKPITPGVCIMQIAFELVQYTLDKKLMLSAVKNVKFLEIISPDKQREVHFTINKINETSDSIAEGTFKAQISVTSADSVYAKLSLIMQPE